MRDRDGVGKKEEEENKVVAEGRGGWVVSLKKRKFFTLSFILFESNLLLLGGLFSFLLRILENAGE